MLDRFLICCFSGESPGVYAREPLLPVFDQLKANKVQVLYGDHDWLRSNSTAAEIAVQALAKQNAEPSPSHKSYSVDIVTTAGHHLYLDNPESFHGFVQKALA